MTQNILEKQEQIDNVGREIDELKQRKAAIQGYRNVLSDSGSALVEIVQKILKEIGLETELTPEGHPVDLLQKGKVAIEITGTTDNVDSDTDKIFQLARFQDNFRKGEKMILIANTYRRHDPSLRNHKMDFTPDVAEYLKL